MLFAFSCRRNWVFIWLNTLSISFPLPFIPSWFRLLFCHFRLGVLSSPLSALGLELTAHTHLQWRTSGSLSDPQPLCPRSLKNANPKAPTHTQMAGGTHVKGRFSTSSPSEYISQPMFSSAIKTPPFTSFWGAEGTNLQNHSFLIVSQALYRKSPGIFFFNMTMLIQANSVLPALPCPPHSSRKTLTTWKSHAVKCTSALSTPHSSLTLVEWDILIYAWGIRFCC